MNKQEILRLYTDANEECNRFIEEYKLDARRGTSGKNAEDAFPGLGREVHFWLRLR
jgi:hypothetical protein